jgi:hypothetical protein
MHWPDHWSNPFVLTILNGRRCLLTVTKSSVPAAFVGNDYWTSALLASTTIGKEECRQTIVSRTWWCVSKGGGSMIIDGPIVLPMSTIDLLGMFTIPTNFQIERATAMPYIKIIVNRYFAYSGTGKNLLPIRFCIGPPYKRYIYCYCY